MKKALLFHLFALASLAFFFFSVPSGSSQQIGNLSDEADEPLSLKTRTHRYILLEDDFDDIPRKPTRYDYLKEDAEPLRLFARPPGPEFAILNLQWRRGSIFINDLRIVPGHIKKRKWLQPDATGDVFYRLFSDRDQLLQEAGIEIRPVLHFDSADEQTGELRGGAVQRDEFDFTLKIPLPEKSARKILFYRLRPLADFKLRATLQGTTAEELPGEIQIGGIEF